MLNYTLGTIEASEALIKDLYIDLRAKVNAWSKITQQTPQARMGYVGQHLVSVVTGYPGGKSGARGYDLKHGQLLQSIFLTIQDSLLLFSKDNPIFRR